MQHGAHAAHGAGRLHASTAPATSSTSSRATVRSSTWSTSTLLVPACRRRLLGRHHRRPRARHRHQPAGVDPVGHQRELAAGQDRRCCSCRRWPSARCCPASSRWWSGTLNSYYHDRFQPLKFDLAGPVAGRATRSSPSALGLAAGVLWRRTLPAIATTAGGFFVVRLVVESFLRPHYQTPVTVTDRGHRPARGARSAPGSSAGPDAARPRRERTGQVPAGCAGRADRHAAACLTKLGYSSSPATSRPGATGRSSGSRPASSSGSPCCWSGWRWSRCVGRTPDGAPHAVATRDRLPVHTYVRTGRVRRTVVLR